MAALRFAKACCPQRLEAWVQCRAVAEVLLFHHAQGQTDGFLTFADELRAAGHVVHAPDLYDGKTFAELSDGVGYAKQAGFDVIIQRAAAAAENLPAELVYAGFSLGVLPAQMLTQTRPGAQGALLSTAVCRPRSSRLRGRTAFPSRST
jgi:dienelactone hydrolase